MSTVDVAISVISIVGGAFIAILLRGLVLQRDERLYRSLSLERDARSVETKELHWRLVDAEKQVAVLQERVERLEVNSSFGPSTSYHDSVYRYRPQPQQPVTVDEAIEILDTSFKVPPKDQK